MLFITKRGIERIKDEEKLERIVLNRKVSYNNRAAALDRIRDDTVLCGCGHGGAVLDPTGKGVASAHLFTGLVRFPGRGGIPFGISLSRLRCESFSERAPDLPKGAVLYFIEEIAVFQRRGAMRYDDDGAFSSEPG